MPPVKPLSLRDRIKAAAAASAPSMNPESDKPLPPPSKEVAEIPQVAQLVTDKKKALELARMVARLGELTVQKSAIEKESKPLKAAIKMVAGKYSIGEAQVMDWKMKYYSSPRRTLKEDMLKKALLKRGLLPNEITEIIEESIQMSEGYTLKISALGAPELEEGNEG